MSGNMSVVAHNLSAMFSNRQLGITNKNLAKSSEKLSSGFKINRAADDAAGLAISEKMRRQIRGLTQGTANTQDGVSMCQIADGALNEVSDMLHRITELSVKSANDTNTAEDRQAIQQEVNAILSEIDRVSTTTTFNEQQIFAGEQSDVSASHNSGGVSNPIMLDFNGYQVSSNGTVRSVSIGDEAEEDPTYYRASYVSDIKNVGGIITYTANRDIYTPGRIINAGETVSDKNELIGKVLYYKRPDQNPTYHDIYVDNNYEGRASRTLYLFNTTDKTLDIIATGECAHGISARENYFEKGDYNDLIYGHQILNLKTASPWIMVEPYTTSDGSKVVDHLLDQSITGGKLVSDEDVYVLNTSDGSIKKLDSGSDLTGYVKSDGQGKDQYAVIHYPAADMTNPGSTGGNTATNTDGVNTFWIQSGAEAGDGIYLTFGRMDTNILGIHGLDVSTGTGASDSIERSKKAVSKLNEIRSNIGAQQNRLEHTIRHQNNTIENTQAAESAIRDTDMAEEMVRFSNENILAQAGQTMLAQANQSKQGIMSLLQ